MSKQKQNVGEAELLQALLKALLEEPSVVQTCVMRIIRSELGSTAPTMEGYAALAHAVKEQLTQCVTENLILIAPAECEVVEDVAKYCNSMDACRSTLDKLGKDSEELARELTALQPFLTLVQAGQFADAAVIIGVAKENDVKTLTENLEKYAKEWEQVQKRVENNRNHYRLCNNVAKNVRGYKATIDAFVKLMQNERIRYSGKKPTEYTDIMRSNYTKNLEPYDAEYILYALDVVYALEYGGLRVDGRLRTKVENHLTENLKEILLNIATDHTTLQNKKLKKDFKKSMEQTGGVDAFMTKVLRLPTDDPNSPS